MPPIIDGTVSTYGAPDPSRLSRLWQSARPALWGLFAAALICGAAVLVGGCSAPADAHSSAPSRGVMAERQFTVGNADLYVITDFANDVTCYSLDSNGSDRTSISCVRGVAR